MGLLFSAYLLYATKEPKPLQISVVYAESDVGRIPKELRKADIAFLPSVCKLYGEMIDTEAYGVFSVSGNSLNNRDIHSGDIVLSKPVINVYTDLAEHNVIVLRIANRLGSYKLREFIKVVTVKDYDKSRDDILKSLPDLDSEFPAKLDKCIAQ